jgi:hypothetical protein
VPCAPRSPPFTVHDSSTDPDRNGVTYSGTGRNAVTVESDGGRNGARGPGFFKADLRLGYRFRFGERRLEVFGEVFNLTDRASFERAGAVPRTGQLGMRFTF